MANRVHPIRIIKFRPIESEILTYSQGILHQSGSPLKCLKIIDNRFKVYVDYGFKGNSRYANEKSDYYVIDLHDSDALLLPSDNDYGSIVATLAEKADSERPMTDLVSDVKVLVLTMTHLVHDGWLFTQEQNGDVVAFQPDYREKKRFSTDDKLKAWILDKAQDY